MPKLRCNLFGHKLEWGYGGGQPYLKIMSRGFDNVGRHHASIRSKCERCGEEFTVCYVHLPVLAHAADKDYRDKIAPRRFKRRQAVQCLS